jgi:hypothetical protein
MFALIAKSQKEEYATLAQESLCTGSHNGLHLKPAINLRKTW